ncbi:LLM class flavin-dependent oxidoreductase [Reyranella sp.]|uniref:LLM class flavin-dependent oxidoreductase n=1 Tax=Reyranella sp. TaxID=1929291 RepID=UPI003BA9D068
MASSHRPKKQLRLGAFMRPVSIHTAAWRYPGGTPDANFNLKALIRYAQTLERGRFDAFFMADHLAVLNMPMEALKRSATVTSFDPLTLLPALAMHTERLGLIATASTTFEPAYTIARRFASLDHISDGRAGWNLVTTSNPDAALNFGMDEQMEHAERYARAREFFDVVTGLWDSWADDAFVRDVESGIYFDPAKLHVLNHEGRYLKVRGPLNIARPVQGWPVVVQAGASDAGRQLAAETAEMVFAAGGPIEAGREFYGDVKARAARAGRNPDHIKILPGAFVVVGSSLDEAREKRARLDSLVSYDSGIAALSIAIGQDARKFDPDGPLPEIPDTNASKSGRERVVALARRENLTVRQIAGRLGGYGGLGMLGTPAMIADQMEEWLTTGACDGFNVMFPYLPGGLDDFVDRVVPELQRRGLFRTEYEGRTLRENLGLPRPENRFFAVPAKAAE